MAGDMNMVTRLLPWLLVGLSVAHAAPVEPLPGDPTQPPAGFLGESGDGVGMSTGLTSVILPRTGRPSAIIDGEQVSLGGMVRGARVIRISESGAVLKGRDGVERLYLTPDVEKKINRAEVARRPDKNRN